MKETRIIFKTDQEPSMTSVQTAVQELRPKDVIPINSPVGESECNGRVENTIRRIQEKTRAPRHGLEKGIRDRIQDNALVMAWLVRWAAELLSKYSPGDDGRTPCERIRGSQCKTPLVPFGETIMYLPMKTVHRNKGEPAKLPGVWLGINERTEEVLVGTHKGIVKCRTVSRLSKDQCWDAAMVNRMKGVPWEVVPGRPGVAIPVEIQDNGDVTIAEDDDVERVKPMDDEDNVEMKFKGGLDRLHVSRKASERYGQQTDVQLVQSYNGRDI